ncbi:MAG: HAD-IA family hydrolase, partial [Candidatus Micrarchaeota archaeon]|nr:HAD-IA family hydrolase [Candidatus Micrarchaeota archaeon]
IAWLGFESFSSSAALLILFLAFDYLISAKLFYYFRLYTTRVMCFDVNGVLVTGDFKKERLSPMPGIYELLDNLRQTHVLCVIGNNNELMAMGLHKNMGFDKYFDHPFQSSGFGTKKPDPAYFKMVGHRIGVNPKRMVFADDLAENVDGAKKAGCDGFVFTTTEKYRKDLATIGISA